MPARGGDLECTLDRVLSHDMGEIQRTAVAVRHRRRGTGRQRRAAAQMGEQAVQVGDRNDRDACGIGRLGCVLRRDENRAEARVARGKRH